MTIHRSTVAALLAAVTALALTACGSSSSSSGTSSQASSSALSGKGKPPITLGTKNFTEEFILGELYRQELEHYGYTVRYKPNIGATEIVDKALTSGQIDAYPEYTGESFATVFGIKTQPKTPLQEYQLAKAAYRKRGQSMSSFTPFQDVDALATLKAYAQTYALTSTADLKRVSHFVLGARPEFQGRFEGAVGMQQVYGVKNFTFKSLALGLQYGALDKHAIDAADIFTTDPQLASGRYRVLPDPRHIFGFQNIALVINTDKLRRLGGQTFMNIIDKVNRLLTTSAVIAMNKAVAIDKQSPAAVAHAFLKANRLL